MIKIFQTKNAAKKKFFHILGKDMLTDLRPLCRVSGYYITKHDTREMANEQMFDGSQILCPSCVSMAYSNGIIKIYPCNKLNEHDEYPPCVLCGGKNDMAEICYKCSKTYNPYVDLEQSGGSAVQDGRNQE